MILVVSIRLVCSSQSPPSGCEKFMPFRGRSAPKRIGSSAPSSGQEPSRLLYECDSKDVDLSQLRVLKIKHPVDPKLILHHPKPGTPEHFLQRHDRRPLFAKRSKEPLNFRITLTLHAHREIVALLERHSRQSLASGYKSSRFNWI